MDYDDRHVSALDRIACSLDRIAVSLEAHHQAQREPVWAQRLEHKMADLAQALIDLQATDQSVVDELTKLADEVRNAPSTQAAADAIEAEVAKLSGAVTAAETPAAPPADQPPA